MKRNAIRILSLFLVVMTLVGVISVPVSAAYSYPMNYTITYKTSDGKVLDTKSGTVDAAADTRNALRITSPSFDGYVLKNDSDAVVTGSMISWNFPASNYVRHGTGSYTVYYEKACKMVVHYVYGASRRTATADKTAYGKRGSSYTIYSPTISGYTPSKSSVSGTFSSESSSATVYYYESTYTISFNANGGSGAPSSITKKHFTNATLPTATPSRTGYTFKGWGTSSSTSYAAYQPGSTFYTNASMTLYAVWSAKTYTISYNANGGSGVPGSQTKYHGIKLLIPSVEPTRNGYGKIMDAFGGENIEISATSKNHINAMDINMDYADGQNPVTLKSEYMLSLCEQAVCDLGPKQKSLIDRCTANLLNGYMRSGFCGKAPTLKDFYEELKAQPEPEAKDIALSLELFTSGSLDTFAGETNVDTKNRLICYDIHDLGRALMPIGMLVVLDNILNRITANKARGRKTYIFIDEIYLLFKHEYSANFLFTLWKRVRKYGAFITGITQNVEDLLQSHTARTMLANSELVVMLNQAATDREELASLMGISDLQMGYITNVDAGHGLVKIGGALVPFVNKVPKDTKLYALMTTKFGES